MLVYKCVMSFTKCKSQHYNASSVPHFVPFTVGEHSVSKLKGNMQIIHPDIPVCHDVIVSHKGGSDVASTDTHCQIAAQCRKQTVVQTETTIKRII